MSAKEPPVVCKIIIHHAILAAVDKPLGSDGRELKMCMDLKTAAVSRLSVPAQSGWGGGGESLEAPN